MSDPVGRREQRVVQGRVSAGSYAREPAVGAVGVRAARALVPVLLVARRPRRLAVAVLVRAEDAGGLDRGDLVARIRLAGPADGVARLGQVLGVGEVLALVGRIERG